MSYWATLKSTKLTTNEAPDLEHKSDRCDSGALSLTTGSVGFGQPHSVVGGGV